MAWEPIELAAPVLQNVAESALHNANATVENAFVTELGGLTRFPGLKPFVELDGTQPVVLTEWRGDLVAVNRGGRIWRITPDGTAADVTGAAVVGHGRPVFAKTEGELLIAAGGPIVRLAGARSELLSRAAPESTHVAFVSGYVVAIEPRSGRFYHSKPGAYDQWDPLDVFSAEGKPDNLTAALVTQYAELLLCGPASIEQFDAVPGGTKPFFRRWMLGDGVHAPYTLVPADNGVWAVNSRLEWTRFTGQSAEPVSMQVQQRLEAIDDWADAWATEIAIAGQRFMVIQAPRATNPHGTAGVTLLHDYRQGHWGALYGWDAATARPARWPGWSHVQIGGRHFVGGDGRVHEMIAGLGTLDGQPQVMRWRSGHLDRSGGALRVDDVRLRLVRGRDHDGPPPVLSLRANKDGRGFGRWARKSLGRPGDRAMTVRFGPFGMADTWQWELEISDPGPVDIVSLEMEVTAVR